MRRAVPLTQLLLLSGAFLGPSFAHASLSAHFQRGEKIVDLPVAGRNAEVCVIPKAFFGWRIFLKRISRSRPSFAI